MNAKEEMLYLLEGKKIKCAIVNRRVYRENHKPIVLKVGHTMTDYNRFLDELDFEYDNGYGGQELFGTVWFKDGTWAARGEYDGSEWWEHYKLPDVPEELNK